MFHTGPVQRRTVMGSLLAGAIGLGSTPALASGRTPGTESTTAALWDVAAWEALYLSAHAAEHATHSARSLNGESQWIYFIAYPIDGALAAARATGDATYLDIALTYAENVVSTALPSTAANFPASSYQDGYLGWISYGPNSTNGDEIPLYESYCWRYVTLMLRVIRETPQWYSDPSIRARFDALLDFSEVHIFEKWDNRPQTAPIPKVFYRSRTHMTAHWAFIAQNLSALTSDPTRKAAYDAVVDTIDAGPIPYFGSSLRQQLINHPSNSAAYFFDWIWGQYALPGSDVSHGNNVISYVIEAQQVGTFWTATDLDRFTVLFDTIIWPTPTTFAEWVDGTGTGGGFVSDGWMKLARHDADLQLRLQDNTQSSYTVQYYGNGALNAALLGM